MSKKVSVDEPAEQTPPVSEVDKILMSMTQGVDYVRASYLAIMLVFGLAGSIHFYFPTYRLHTSILMGLCVLLAGAIANLQVKMENAKNKKG